jgi:23S rRNA pseudouridine1911/1915/1917 synthase
MEVLYEDQALLAVAKPSGLPTLPGGGLFMKNTLLALVRRLAPEAHPMHRLGRATSGVVLFARTAAAASLVQQALREGLWTKVYRALVDGHPARDEFSVDAPIGEVPHALLGSVHAASAHGKPSRSSVRVLQRRPGCALAEVQIETGRPHQIRIHLAHAGHPLCGDPLYRAGGLPKSSALPGDAGYHLHAMRLSLVHPATGAPLTIECAPPPLLR